MHSLPLSSCVTLRTAGDASSLADSCLVSELSHAHIEQAAHAITQILAATIADAGLLQSRVLNKSMIASLLPPLQDWEQYIPVIHPVTLDVQYGGDSSR